MSLRSLAIILLAAMAVSSAGAQWTEKWPVDVKIVESNAVSIFLRAHFGKVGEIAAKQVESILTDPRKQAKLANSTIKQLEKIYERYLQSRGGNEATAQVVAAQEFINAISAAHNFDSPSEGQLGLVVSYVPTYGLMKLQWNRQANRNACQRFVCSCPDGSSRPFPGTFCPVNQGGFQTNVPASCTTVTDIVDSEAEYAVYRNSKLLAIFDGNNGLANGQAFTFNQTFGPVSVSLSAILSPRALGQLGRSAPFYDFDPQNSDIGTTLTYRVTANSKGCSQPYATGQFYNNQFTGLTGAQSVVTVDSDGDGRPDFYSAENFFMDRLPSPSAAVILTVPEDLVWFWEDRAVTINVAGSNPSGTVKFYNYGRLMTQIPVLNGFASVMMTTLNRDQRDDYAIVAEYSGDANNPPGFSQLKYIQAYRD